MKLYLSYSKFSLLFKKCHRRRERDSNSRYPFEYGGFQNRSLKPLGHLSVEPKVRFELTVGFYPASLQNWSSRPLRDFGLVDLDRIELTTSSLQSWRSPN